MDDSISEVIDVLRGTVLSDGKSTELPKEYEDTDRSVHHGVSVIEILGRILFINVFILICNKSIE